jgi:hypothetical protein
MKADSKARFLEDAQMRVGNQLQTAKESTQKMKEK